MSALLRFFVRFALVFEFLLLETIAFVLIFNTNAFQQSIIYNANTAIVASVYQATNAWSDYFHLEIDISYLRSPSEFEGVWVHPQDLKNYALPTVMKKIIRASLKEL